MIKFLILSLALLCCACNSHQEIVGAYQNIEGYGVGEKLKINSDSTFDYEWRIGLNNGKTSGYWQRKDNHIIQNGGIKQTEQIIEVQEYLQPNYDSISIQLYDFENFPIWMAVAKINDTQSVHTDTSGIAIIEKIKVEKIKIYYITFEIPEYEVKNSDANHFVIRIYTEINKSVFFDNSKIQIKGRKLIMENNPWNKEVSVKLKRRK